MKSQVTLIAISIPGCTPLKTLFISQIVWVRLRTKLSLNFDKTFKFIIVISGLANIFQVTAFEQMQWTSSSTIDFFLHCGCGPLWTFVRNEEVKLSRINGLCQKQTASSNKNRQQIQEHTQCWAMISSPFHHGLSIFCVELILIFYLFSLHLRVIFIILTQSFSIPLRAFFNWFG